MATSARRGNSMLRSAQRLARPRRRSARRPEPCPLSASLLALPAPRSGRPARVAGTLSGTSARRGDSVPPGARGPGHWRAPSKREKIKEQAGGILARAAPKCAPRRAKRRRAGLTPNKVGPAISPRWKLPRREEGRGAGSSRATFCDCLHHRHRHQDEHFRAASASTACVGSSAASTEGS